MAQPSTGSGPARAVRGQIAQAAASALGLLACSLLVLAPFVWLALDGLPWRPETLALAVPRGRRLMLLLRSAGLAALVAVATTSAGGMAALRLATLRRGLPTPALWLLLVTLVMPPYIHALAWSAATDALAGLLQPLGLHVRLTGLAGSALVQGMSLLPVAVGLALLGLYSTDGDLLDAARLLRGDAHCLRHVLLPLAAPYLLAGAGLIICLSLLDYTIPALFETNVYALEVLAEYSASAEPMCALAISVPLMATAGLVVLVCQRPLRRAGLQRAWRAEVWQATPRWPPVLVFAQTAAIALLVLHLLVPTWALLATLGDLRTAAMSVATGWPEIRYSATIALAAALVCLPLGLVAASHLAQARRLANVWWALMLTPLAVPGALVGIGLISLWLRWSPRLVYGSDLMPVLACAARFLPWAALVLLAQARRNSPALWDAARLMPVSAWRRLVRVRLPMLAPGLLAAAGLVIALALGELAATLLTLPPGRSTLSVRVFNYLHYGASATVAALCLVLAAAATVGGACIVLAARLWAARSAGKGV